MVRACGAKSGHRGGVRKLLLFKSNVVIGVSRLNDFRLAQPRDNLPDLLRRASVADAGRWGRGGPLLRQAQRHGHLSVHSCATVSTKAPNGSAFPACYSETNHVMKGRPKRGMTPPARRPIDCESRFWPTIKAARASSCGQPPGALTLFCRSAPSEGLLSRGRRDVPPRNSRIRA
jgi:hypothetical protein